MVRWSRPQGQPRPVRSVIDATGNLERFSRFSGMPRSLRFGETSLKKT